MTSIPEVASSTNGNGTLDFPIVGIGASAGGLDAFKRFFNQMPFDSGAAFVLVPHLDPTHESLMVELLARQTKMKVCEATDDLRLEPNYIYVIPPNKYLAIHDGKLQLSSPPQRFAVPTAIDFFLCSLASQKSERSIGIILSGTGSHGTLGIREIKLAGGMVMVQKPESAEYDQMPRSAIATGLADFILPPDEMPDALVKYLKHPYIQGDIDEKAEEGSNDQLNRILAVLKSRTKYDFRSYRKKMLIRRVQRRMGLCHVEKMSDYLNYLRDNPDEVIAMYKDLLIGVTEFFRDSEAFQVLQQRVIPAIVEKSIGQDATATSERPEADASLEVSTSKPIRVWIPACATGEEAYSVVILLLEQLAIQKKRAEIQVFATDIDESSLEAARLGIYSESSTSGISPERLQRFFSKVDQNHWQVKKELRDSVTFAPQNLISDAPFSKLDLICCRNLLIYLEPEVQAKVMRLFHFALGEGGFLFLGPSESIGREVELFETLSKKWRIFRRIGTARRRPVEIPIVATESRPQLPTVSVGSTPIPSVGFKELMQRLILEDFGPAAALINRNYEIISVLGPLVNYLEFPPGEITKDLLAMVRPGLRTKVRAAIHKAIQNGEPVVDLDSRVKRAGKYIPCAISVKPVNEPKNAAGSILVTFRDRDVVSPVQEGEESQPVQEAESQLLSHLEYELKSTRDDLQTTIEEYENSTEELKASHEEVMSMNEELQSANEELETSKEELQSLNEELTTVNSQLQEKVEELDRSNNDLLNLMNSSEIATVFLDTELKIKRFTPSVAKLLSLRSNDVGRPISELAIKIVDDALLDDCRTVLDKLTPIEKLVTTENSHHATVEASLLASSSKPSPRYFLRRVLPYRTSDNIVGGLVVAFIDISDRIASESQSRRLASVLLDSNDAVTVQGFDGKIMAWNRGAERIYGYSESEALQMNIRDTVPENKREEALAYVQTIVRDEPVKAFETQRRTKAGIVLDVELTVTAYRDEHSKVIGVATTERDISERKKLATELGRLNESLEERVADQTREIRLLAKAISHLGEGVIITADELDWPGPKIVFANNAMCQISGYAREELIGQTPRILQGPGTLRGQLENLKNSVSSGNFSAKEMTNYRKDGTPYEVELLITPIFDEQGRRTNFVAIHRDITERKLIAEFSRQQHELSETIINTARTVVLLLDAEGRIVRFNPYFEEISGRQLDEVRGKSWFEHFLPESHRDLIRDRFQHALMGVRTTAGNTPIVTKDGELREIEWYDAPLTDKNGKVVGLLFTGQDITQRLIADRAIYERENRIRAILNAATDAIVSIDKNGLIQTVNPATEEMFGFRQADLVGQKISILLPKPYCDEYLTHINRYLETKESHVRARSVELLAKRKDGSVFPVDLAVSRVDHLNELTGIIRDISFRKELQRQVLAIAAEEQRRIGQELHDGTGQELTGLGLFAAGMTKMLNSMPKKSVDNESIWTVDDGSLSLLRQTASRLEQGLFESNLRVQKLSHGIMPVQVEPDGLCSALSQLASETDEHQNINCRFYCQTPIAVANNTVATHLYRIAQEAVNNALKHGKATDIRISLSTSNDDIILEVSDNGKGFYPGTVRQDKDGLEKPNGFGIEIMKYRAEMSGGTFRLSHQESGGMMVKCTVPKGQNHVNV